MLTCLPIAFLGPTSSGKSALIHSALNTQTQIFPTAGLQINHITSTSRTILAYDCSGQPNNKNNWTLIGQLAEAVVFVIDAANVDNFASNKKYLYRFLEQHPFMRGKPLCIMLNKCDIKERAPKQLLVRALQPQKIGKMVSKYYIKQTSAFNKEGIDQCLQWLIKSVPAEQDNQ